MKKKVGLLVALVAMSVFADVKRTDVKPTVDGRLDEAAWASADWEGGFLRSAKAKGGRTPTASTSFAFLADADALYVGVRAENKKMDELKARGKDAIWGAETVEFWLCPDGGTFDVYQFVATFQGQKVSLFYSEEGNIQPDPFGPDWDYKIAETPEGWTCEARIPLSAFYMTRGIAWKPTWKVNVTRTYRDAVAYDVSSWCDRNHWKDFKNFKPVGGFPIRRAGEDVWVKSVVACADGRQGDGLKGRMDFIVNVAQPGTFTLSSDFTEKREVTFKAGDNKLTLPAVFPENGRHLLPLTLTRTDGSGTCRRTYPVIVDYQALRLKFAKPSYRGNFYPGQNADRVEGTVVSAVAGPVEVTLEGPGFGTRTATLPEKGGAFAFDTKGFLDGTALLTVKAGGETLTRKVRKLAPLGEGRHVSWIENGNLVIDGKPVLRRNMYAEYYLGGEAFKKRYDADDLHLTKVAGVGCGTLEPNRLIKGTESKEAIRDVRPCAEIYAKVDERIAAGLKGNGVYYYISDEPECRGVSPVYLKHLYDYVCDKDPYHVVLMCSRAGEKYIDCADWFETHPYINPHEMDGKRVYGRQFNEIGDFVSAFNSEKHPDKCIGCVPTCYPCSAGSSPDFPEYVANVWCELLRGAKTLYPFAYYSLGDRAALYEGTRYVFSSAEALEDILLHGRRETLVKTPDYEAALWTMPDGEKMFCVQNFTTAPLKAEVPGLAGSFTEFRGNRKFDFHCQPQPSTSTFSLSPLESLVATTKKRDAGLPTFAETQALVDRLEKERLGRPNQLLGREREIAFATSAKRTGERAIVDGVRDVQAWYDVFGKDKFYEMSFPKFVPQFSELTVYGNNIDGLRVKVRMDGEWKELAPVRTEKGEYSLRYVFDRVYSTVKLRLEFPKNKVELYEIELPGKVRENGVSAAATVVPDGTALWKRQVPAGQVGHFTSSVPVASEPTYVTFDLRPSRKLKDGGYTSWGIFLEKTAGSLAGNVRTAIPGLYTLRVPAYTGERKSTPLIVRNRNLALEMGEIVCTRERPANAVEFVEAAGQWTVRVTLAEKCEDLVCNVCSDHGTGPGPFAVNGVPSLDLKPTDGTGKVWGCTLPIPPEGLKRNKRGDLPRPFVRVTVLGGAIDRQLLTWLCRSQL